MKTIDAINNFLSSDKIAVAGVSRHKYKFGNQVYRYLKKRGYSLLPINPFSDNIDGEVCYPDVASLPEAVDALIIVTKSSQTEHIIDSAIAKGIKNIWVQQNSETPRAIKMLENSDVNYISDQCILMFASPSGIHGLHAFISKMFCKYPK